MNGRIRELSGTEPGRSLPHASGTNWTGQRVARSVKKWLQVVRRGCRQEAYSSPNPCLRASLRGTPMALHTIPAPLLFPIVFAFVLAGAGLLRRSGVLLVLAAVLVATAAGFAFSAMALA